MRSKTLRLVVCTVVLASCRKSANNASRRFTLPGWDDVMIGQPPPRDVELTCQHANDIAECAPLRSTAPIQEVNVVRRPDKYGVVKVWAINVDAKLTQQIATRWGAATETSHDGVLWCADDATFAAFIEKQATPSGATVFVTAEPESDFVQRCVQRGAKPNGHPASATVTPIEQSTSAGRMRKACEAYSAARYALCMRCNGGSPNGDIACADEVVLCDNVAAVKNVDALLNDCVPRLNKTSCADVERDNSEPLSCDQFTLGTQTLVPPSAPPPDQRGVHVSKECLENPLAKGCN